MSAEDIELREWIGWVKVTAEAEGWSVDECATARVSNAVGPTLILDRGRTIAVKLKTESAYRSRENVPRGGLSKGQAERRDAWSGEWHTWCPSQWREAAEVLSGGPTRTEPVEGGRNGSDGQSSQAVEAAA